MHVANVSSPATRLLMFIKIKKTAFNLCRSSTHREEVERDRSRGKSVSEPDLCVVYPSITDGGGAFWQAICVKTFPDRTLLQAKKSEAPQAQKNPHS